MQEIPTATNLINPENKTFTRVDSIGGRGTRIIENNRGSILSLNRYKFIGEATTVKGSGESIRRGLKLINPGCQESKRGNLNPAIGGTERKPQRHASKAT